MKRLVTSAAIAAVVLGFGVEPSRAADPNVIIQVLDSSGKPVSDGLTIVREYFANTSNKTKNGQVALLLPEGKHNLSVHSAPDPINSNTTISYFSFEVNVSGRTSVSVKLPPVIEVAFNAQGAASENGYVGFSLMGFDANNTEGFFGGSPGFQHFAEVRIGDSVSQARGGTSILTSVSDSSMGPITADNSFCRIRCWSLRISDGIIKLRMFSPIPLSEYDAPFNNAALQSRYDYDGDGYRDLSYGFKTTSNRWESERISYKQLATGTVKASQKIPGEIVVDSYSSTQSNDFLVITGQVRVSSAPFLTVNSPIQAYTFIDVPSTKQVIEYQIGKSNLDTQGRFKMSINVASLLRLRSVANYFFLATPTGLVTVNLQIPSLIKKYKNCSTMNRDFPGGVARSESAVNKGGKIKQKPSINSRVYDLNKGLDRDKDGLACER